MSSKAAFSGRALDMFRVDVVLLRKAGELCQYRREIFAPHRLELMATLLIRAGRVRAFGILLSIAPTVVLAQVPGGSNYFYYHAVDLNSPTNTCLGTGGSPGFGIVSDYYLTDHICGDNATVRSIIGEQLTAMARNGQQNLSLPIFFAESGKYVANPNNQCPTIGGNPGNGGTIKPLSDGTIPPNCLKALRSIISTAYDAGFQSVRVRFVALGPNDPYTWSEFDRRIAAYNWKFIQTVHAGLSEFGLGKYDLGNESIAGSNLPVVLEYARWIWGRYTATYGTTDTIGFSVPCGDVCAVNISSFSTVYGSNLPPMFDFHIYGSDCPGLVNAENQTLPVDQVYNNILSVLRAHGWSSQAWIIGETCYNDAKVAKRFRTAYHEAGNVLDSIEQWPPISLTSVPLEYANYLKSPQTFR